MTPDIPPGDLPTATQLLARTAAVFRVSVADILGPNRTRRIVRARQAAAWVLRHSPHFFDYSQDGAPVAARRSVSRIAGLLGRTDHSSIIYHLTQANHLRDRDPDWRARLDALLGGGAVAKIRFIPPPPPKLVATPRQIHQRNDFTGGDTHSSTRDSDAIMRQRGSIALAEALAAYQAERAA